MKKNQKNSTSTVWTVPALALVLSVVFCNVAVFAVDDSLHAEPSTFNVSDSLYAKANTCTTLSKSLLGVSLNIADDEEAKGTNHDATDLAKKTQNPVADLISVPFQFNTFFETGPKAKTQNTLLIQPVLPYSLNDDWNFIARPIIPLMELPPLTNAQNRNYGLGNIQFQGFFSPKEKVGDWIMGVGPYLEFPTNSGPDGRFGSDNWSAGPAFVALQMEGPWVYGGLLTHLWSYYGDDPEVNLTSFQPFVNYNMEDGWYLSTAPTITANWSADSSQQWTIPIGGGIGKIHKFGKQPVNISLRAYHNLQSPRNGSDWQLQFQIQFLFPK